MKNKSAMVIACICLLFLSSFDDKPTEKSAIRYVNYSIFGKEYAKTPIFNESMKSHVYYIVSGHGGPDPGAMFQKNDKWLCEDEYAYDVSLRLARNLIGHGARVYMITRDENDGIRDLEYLEPDKDETVWGGANMPLNQKARLKQRSDIINSLYEQNKANGYETQRTIITHVDSRYQDKKVDVFFYYNQNSQSGKILANAIFSTVKSSYDEHQKGRGYEGVVKPRGLWMLNETKPTSVYIELGNISNEFDQKRLLIPNNRQAIANWISEGIQTNN
jgi:N-acetylmuramoyl-L-alanine amidase